jgi:hypothetical protein
VIVGLLSDRIGRRRAMVGSFICAIFVIPLWAYAPNIALLILGAFLMQFMVQGAWGVIPAHITELSPDSVRGFLPGFAYQCGVLLAGKFRTQRQLNTMSAGDQRNTLIVELANRTNQPVPHFQSLDDTTLAGTGAILVFLRESGIRTDQQLKTMSDDDQRNTLIVEVDAQTGGTMRSILQGFNNIELVLLGLGSTAPGDLKSAFLYCGVYWRAIPHSTRNKHDVGG